MLGVMSGATEEVATGAEVSSSFTYCFSDYRLEFNVEVVSALTGD